MFEPLIDLLTQFGTEAIYPVIIYMTLRPVGLLFGFIAFSWAIGPARVLRISVALAIAFPNLVISTEQLAAILQDTSSLNLALLAGKEFVIGYGIGLLASLPFFALQYAGAITDAFRGEADNSIPDPFGGTLQTFSLLYIIIGLAVFASVGGLWGLVATLYASYGVWQIDQLLPALSQNAPSVVLGVLYDMFILAIKTAIPLLALLYTVEFLTGVGAKLSRKFGFQDLSFLLKNMVTVICLPVVAWYVVQLAGPATERSDDALSILKLVFE